MEISFSPKKSVDYGKTEEVNDVQDEGVSSSKKINEAQKVEKKRFSSSGDEDALLLQKGTKIRKIVPEGEKLIHKCLNNVHAHVVKHILCGTLEADEIIEYAFSCLEDVSDLVRQLKKFHVICSKTFRKNAVLTKNVRKIYNILSKYKK
ncbi:hypothetical protein CDAR_496671 [Caerostris darwini]|uniref:Uncharacterized protein n=1 Tax=Caerostris darwini TaxID=1538125 RepID=A0AAV4MSK3_9ARAC|nr:hypothetical protein CDAR_496671 [Caerostris darwini]